MLLASVSNLCSHDVHVKPESCIFERLELPTPHFRGWALGFECRQIWNDGTHSSWLIYVLSIRPKPCSKNIKAGKFKQGFKKLCCYSVDPCYPHWTTGTEYLGILISWVEVALLEPQNSDSCIHLWWIDPLTMEDQIFCTISKDIYWFLSRES